MATTLTYTNSPFLPFTRILSADANQFFTDIQNRLNWAGSTSATTGLADDNMQSNTASGGGLTRNTKLKAGTAAYVVINDANGKMTEEAQLARVRGGTGLDLTTLTSQAGKAIIVNAGATALELGTPVQSTLTLQTGADISSFVAGEAITANDAVCFGLSRDSNNADVYKIYQCDSDLPDRRANFAGIALAGAAVTAHTLTWTDSAALVASNVITYSINGRGYSTTYASSNDATLAAIATQIATDPEVQSAAVVDAGANDRVINVTGRGGLYINITSATVTGGGSQATVAIATVAAPTGATVQVRCFGITSGFSGLTVGAQYYVSGTAGAITTAPTDTNPINVGQAMTTTQLFVNKNVAMFQFSTPSTFVRAGGTSTNAYSGTTSTVEHWNATSWTAGTAMSAARANGNGSQADFQGFMYTVDGYDGAGSPILSHYKYNKASWSSQTNRANLRHSCSGSVLGNYLYVGKGRDSGGSFITNMDRWDGSSWSNSHANLLGTAVICRASFVQGGLAHWVGGSDGATTYTEHRTYDGASVAAGTAATSNTYGGASASPGSNGMVAAGAGNATTSYIWSGSWSASVTMTYAPNAQPAAAGAALGQAQSYVASTNLTFINGGYNAGILSTSAQFNGTSWAASTSSSSGRDGAFAGVI